jgi:hypothetical protein
MFNFRCFSLEPVSSLISFSEKQRHQPLAFPLLLYCNANIHEHHL